MFPIISLLAETVLLKNGESIKGKVMGQDARHLKLKSNGKFIQIEKKKILKVVYKNISKQEEKKIIAQELQKQNKKAPAVVDNNKADTPATKEKTPQLVRITEVHFKDGTVVYGILKRHMGDKISVLVNDKEEIFQISKIYKIAFSNKALESDESQKEVVKKVDKAKEFEDRVEIIVNRNRGSHAAMEQENRRLPLTEGVLELSGGQVLYTEVIDETNGLYLVKTEKGTFLIEQEDMSDKILITDDSGPRIISTRSEMQALKKQQPQEGQIQLQGGTIVTGKIAKITGEHATIASPYGSFTVPVSQIIFPKTNPDDSFKPGVQVDVGQTGDFYFNDDQVITGKLIFHSKHQMIISTKFGDLDMKPEYLVSSVKREPVP